LTRLQSACGALLNLVEVWCIYGYKIECTWGKSDLAPSEF